MKWLLQAFELLGTAVLSLGIAVSATFADSFQEYHDGEGLVVRLSDEKVVPFNRVRSWGSPDAEIEAFPNVISCLPASERSKAKPDLTKFDFMAIGSRAAVEVCIHRIATSYSSICDMAKWLVAKGLDLAFNKTQRDCARYTRIDGFWDTDEKGRLWRECSLCIFEYLFVDIDVVMIEYDKTGKNVVRVIVATVD